MLGAGIGGTVAVQVVAFKVTQFALVLVLVGFLLLFLPRRKKIRQYGAVVMGLGLVFLGMNLMSEATQPLRQYDPFVDLMRRMEDPLVGILIGLLFTAIIQSPAGTMGLVIALAGQGFLSLEAGIALAFGANIGAAITPLLASIGKPRSAVQAAALHTLFRVGSVLVWLPLLRWLAAGVRLISPVYPALSGVAQLAAETPRQIANAHTVFNVGNMLFFIGFVDPLVRLMNWLIPLKDEPELAEVKPKYLDESLLSTPSLALELVRLEIGRLGDYTMRMVRLSVTTVFGGTEDELAKLAAMDDGVDALHGAILIYAGRLSLANLLPEQADKLADYIAIANHLENIGDMVETNLVEAGSERLQQEVHMSHVTQEMLVALHHKVTWAVEVALEGFKSSNLTLAGEVMAAKLDINRLASQAEEHLAHRLIANEPNRLATFRIETDIIEYLKRVYYFAKRIAKIVDDTDRVYGYVPSQPARTQTKAG
jgi:phosphate:Na+ symporter